MQGFRHETGEGNGNPLQYSCLENPTGQLGAGYYPWGGKESGTTERLHFTSDTRDQKKQKLQKHKSKDNQENKIKLKKKKLYNYYAQRRPNF